MHVFGWWHACVHGTCMCAVESALAGVSVGNKVSKMHFVGVLADLSQPMSNEEFKAFTDFLTASIQVS